MAKAVKNKEHDTRIKSTPQHMRTSIGNSKNSKPKNKHTKRSKKPYRGQGR